MKLIIDIPDELYNYIKSDKYDEHLEKRFDFKIRNSVENGTPLPEKHGRLIDENDLLEISVWHDNAYGDEYKIINVDELDEIPTIIEATNEVKDKIKDYEEELER